MSPWPVDGARALLVDAGNTRLKWALLDTRTGEFVLRGHLPTAEAADPDRLRAEWGALAGGPIDGAMFVSVASDPLNAALSSVLASLPGGHVARFRSVEQLATLRNAYANPEQLGADRLAAALGAWSRVQADCLVVNCGTATTIDLLVATPPDDRSSSAPPPDQSGDSLLSSRTGISLGDHRDSLRLPHRDSLRSSHRDFLRSSHGDSLRSQKNAANATFLGGVILPGLSLMKSALFRHTARLPDAAGSFVAIPDNTDDAIATGCLLAQLGAVEALHRQLPDAAPIVLSGGAAAALQPLLQARGLNLIAAPELVLEGLAVAILQRF